MAKRKSMYPWYHQYVLSRVNQLFGWSPEKKQALTRAQIGKDARGNPFWKCEKCGAQPLRKEDREVDHVEPRVPVTGFDDYGQFIKRSLDMGTDGLIVLCKTNCHQTKSKAENALRRKARKAKDVV